MIIMIWSILLIITGAGVLFFAVVFILPFGVKAAYLYNSTDNKLTTAAYLVHPAICKVSYNYTNNSLSVEIFRINICSRKKTDGLKPRADDTIEESVKNADAGKEPETTSGDAAGYSFEQKQPFDNEETDLSEKISKAETDDRSADKLKRGPDIGSGKKESAEASGSDDSDMSKKADGRQKGTKKSLLDRVKSHPAVFFIMQESLREKVIHWLIGIAGCTLRIVRIKQCVISAAVAFDDPSVSGRLYGYTEAARYAIGLYSRRINLKFTPVFENRQNAFDGRIRIATSLGRLTWPVFFALVTFPYYTLGITLWRYRSMMRRGRKAHEKRS